LTKAVCSRISLISSIFSECVLQKFKASRATGADYRDDIETYGPLGRMDTPQVDSGGAVNSRALALIDGLGRSAERGTAAGLDLDEYERLAIGCNQIDFGAGGPKITLQYPITAPRK
jgi:hypothetical protein